MTSIRLSTVNCSFILFLNLLLTINLSECSSPEKQSLPSVNLESIKSNSKVRLLGPCQLCREMIRSFEWCLHETDYSSIESNSNFEQFKDSPERLIKIKEILCSDSKQYENQCKQFADQHDVIINHWWSNERRESIGLYDYLCIEKGKMCCPDGMFGPDCSPCPGYPGDICNGRGSCKGNGTRKGNGQCVCHPSYKGDLCEKCSTGTFVVSEKDNVQECEKCDKSCLGQCKGAGPKGCHVCKPGYTWDADYGCLDIDECIESLENPCKGNTFCVNTEGSHLCYECDKSCDGCHGDGPDSCTKCATDYLLKDGICVDTKLRDREANLENSRYLTYIGLCFATCIIFQKNIYIASAIGLLVALYIGAAEYTVRDIAKSPHPLEKAVNQLFGQ